ncbi:integrase SAM domain protein [Streptomyces sp. BRB081]|uniref:integrase SAM domain protein n=1 Tax=Streptomyces sp. BRB081 TaxID=2769544 RepID=UPI001F5D346E|nr:integrase SAM domain protein [Streptomyces sp. BRB081]
MMAREAATRIHTSDEITWPADDTLVLRSRPIHPGTMTGEMATFGDSIWPLTPAHPDLHADAINLHWKTYPPTLADQFKCFVLATLDHPHPVIMSGQKTHDQASCGNIKIWFMRQRAFAIWLEHHDVEHLSDVDDGLLDAYLEHVRALSVSDGAKYQLLNAVRALWAYSKHLPADCRLDTAVPWNGVPIDDLLERLPPGRFNATPRIAAATMEALLDWSLRIIEDLGPDICSAWTHYELLEAGRHPSQHGYQGLSPRERLLSLTEELARTGGALPGVRGNPGKVSAYHLGRLLGLEKDRRYEYLAQQARVLADEAGIPIADDCYVGTISGRISDRPWRDRPITVAELPRLIRILMAAGFVVICYLTGARPGEALALRRGCRAVDEETSELLIQGRRGKGFDRTPLDPVDPKRPWVTVQPVHDTIAMLESLHDADLLFPASLHKKTRRARKFAPRTWQINRDMEILLAWVNDTFAPEDGSLPIPPDPTKHLHGSRFRRTLAYFIVRRPRGLIAAALQYSHVSTKVTLRYAGEGDTSWAEDLAVEKLEMVLEQNDDDWTRLQDGEHVSGPSAGEYRSRLGGVARFSGRVVRAVRSVERLLDQVDPDIHHGDAMTCVHRAETAECRKEKLALGLAADSGPDESFCRRSCSNLIYTDRDIAQLRGKLSTWDATAHDPLAPQPRRARAAALAAQARSVIEAHEAIRPDTRQNGDAA